MARQWADKQDGWALAKRGKAAKAIKIEETGDGVPVGTQRDLGCTFQPLTASKQKFRAWVAALLKATHGDNRALSDVLAWNLGRLEEEGHTTRTTDQRYKRLIAFLGEGFGILDLNVKRCKDYASHMEREGYAPNTIWGDLNVLRSALKKAYQYEEIAKPVHEHLWNVNKPGGREGVVMSPEQFWAWYDGCTSHHLRLFLMLALLTAQRHEAICQLRWDHCDFDEGTVDFTASMRKRRSVKDKGYQKDRAVVHMTETLRGYLVDAKQVAKTEYVIEYQGRPILGHMGVSDGVRAARASAGLPDWVTPHVLRHTAATWAEDDGLDLHAIARMTGHREERTLKGVYLHGKKTGKGSQQAVEAVEKRMGGRLRVVK